MFCLGSCSLPGLIDTGGKVSKRFPLHGEECAACPRVEALNPRTPPGEDYILRAQSTNLTVKLQTDFDS